MALRLVEHDGLLAPIEASGMNEERVAYLVEIAIDRIIQILGSALRDVADELSIFERNGLDDLEIEIWYAEEQVRIVVTRDAIQFTPSSEF